MRERLREIRGVSLHRGYGRTPPPHLGPGSPGTTSPSDQHQAPPGSLPAFLTVQEAATLLRVGRTTAYDLVRQWFATKGRCGIPAVRIGRQVRVPLRKLEEMAGGALSDRDGSVGGAAGGAGASEAADAAEPVDTDPGAVYPNPALAPEPLTDPALAAVPPLAPPERRRRSRPPAGGQSSLFGEAS